MYANAERTRVRWRGRASAGDGERRRAPAFTLRLMSLVACKITVVGGRRFTGPYFHRFSHIFIIFAHIFTTMSHFHHFCSYFHHSGLHFQQWLLAHVNTTFNKVQNALGSCKHIFFEAHKTLFFSILFLTLLLFFEGSVL